MFQDVRSLKTLWYVLIQLANFLVNGLFPRRIVVFPVSECHEELSKRTQDGEIEAPGNMLYEWEWSGGDYLKCKMCEFIIRFKQNIRGKCKVRVKNTKRSSHDFT